MRVDLDIDRENNGLWRGYITLHNRNGDTMTAATDNYSQSANAAWDAVISILQRAINEAEKNAANGVTRSLNGKP